MFSNLYWIAGMMGIFFDGLRKNFLLGKAIKFEVILKNVRNLEKYAKFQSGVRFY